MSRWAVDWFEQEKIDRALAQHVGMKNAVMTMPVKMAIRPDAVEQGSPRSTTLQPGCARNFNGTVPKEEARAVQPAPAHVGPPRVPAGKRLRRRFVVGAAFRTRPPRWLRPWRTFLEESSPTHRKRPVLLRGRGIPFFLSASALCASAISSRSRRISSMPKPGRFQASIGGRTRRDVHHPG